MECESLRKPFLGILKAVQKYGNAECRVAMMNYANNASYYANAEERLDAFFDDWDSESDDFEDER